MADLFNVPGDTGAPWRFHQMVKYISSFPDEIGPIINDYMKSINATPDDRVWWCLLYSSCYCMGSAMVMMNELDFRTVTDDEIDKFWENHKPRLIFQSDRRYIKNMNQFTIIAKEFLQRSNRKPWEYISQFVTDDPEETYKNLYKEVKKWKYYGRFGIILFIFNLCKLFPIEVESKDYDWKNGATTTSAIFHAQYDDQKAIDFDAGTYKLTEDDLTMLDATLDIIIKALKKANPNKNWNVVYVSSDLCSFRKLFKASRYPGFYIDRQQQEIEFLEKTYPEYQDMWNFVWDGRKRHLDDLYLGETHTWHGPRTYHNRRFLETGLVTAPEN